METLTPAEPMQLDSDVNETLEAFRDLSINLQKPRIPRSTKRGNPRLSYSLWRSRLTPNGRCPQQIKRQIKDLEASRIRRQALVTLLCDVLQGRDPLNTFYTNYYAVVTDWNKLLAETKVPSNASSASPEIIRAFKITDGVICGERTSHLLRRLAYVHLMQLFNVLESIIRLERETGQVLRGRYYRDASVALDIYMGAQEDTSNAYFLRRKLKERKRAGRSWRDLSDPSPLFVLMYSDAAERIV
ncbi:hypothetical protein H9Q74_012316 [Fusarium xylarioides]|nr:hypothetical protein H9Q71_012085 [Fusarium xylarioides]KAG5814301.1 hypothetical protein H9Q74_012316 [Fusarium xylarioides]